MLVGLIAFIFGYILVYNAFKKKPVPNQTIIIEKADSKLKNKLQVGKEIIFTDTNSNLVKCIIKKVHVGEGNKIVGCEAKTSDNELVDLSVAEDVFYEIAFSKIQVGMKIVFYDCENSLLKGEITRVTIGEEDNIIGCEVVVEDMDGVFDLTYDEDKIYVLFSNN